MTMRDGLAQTGHSERIGEARRAIKAAVPTATNTQIVLVETAGGAFDIGASVSATISLVTGDGYPGIVSDEDAAIVCPYDHSYRVDAGVGDWGYAIVATDVGFTLTTVRRGWYERPRHKSPCAPVLRSQIFASESAAHAEIERRIAECTHDWRPISHEEFECKICGDVQFSPDI